MAIVRPLCRVRPRLPRRVPDHARADRQLRAAGDGELRRRRAGVHLGAGLGQPRRARPRTRRCSRRTSSFPLPHALAYGEHLFGISLFTLPVYAATRNPVLAYNLVWILAYVLSAAAVHVLAWRYTRDHLAAMTAALAFTFCFFRMHHGHGHLNLIWCFWIPLSFVAMDRWTERPTWTRLAAWIAVIVLQALAAWYQAVLIVVADAIFLGLAVRRRTTGAASVQDRAARRRRGADRVCDGVAVCALLLHPARRAAVICRGGRRRSRRLVGAAGEHVDGAVAPGASGEGAEVDLG